MTFSDFLVSFGPFIVALMALLGTAYNIRSQRPVTESTAASKMAEASSSTIDDLMQEIKRLGDEIARLNLKVATQLLQIQELHVSAKRSLELTSRLITGITILIGQIHKTNILPAWTLDPEIERLVRLATDDSDRLAIPRIIVNKDGPPSP